MGRSKEQQKLFDEIGEDAYYRLNKERYKKKHNKEYHRNWHKNNKENHKDYLQSPAGIKSLIIACWKPQNITFGNTTRSEYYDNVFLPTTHCNSCNKEFIKKKDKHLDHIHLDIPFNARGVLCHSCNIQDAWRWRMRPDSIYNMYVEQHNLYLMEKKREYTIQNHLDLD